MRLTDLLSEKLIIPNLVSRHKKEALRELCELVAADNELDPKPLLEVLLERERLGSTGIGDGIAIPHGKDENIPKLLVAFGRSMEGVDFDSMDNRPAHLFFVILAPGDSTETHLKVLAKISRLLKDESFQREVYQAASAEDIYKLIAARDEGI